MRSLINTLARFLKYSDVKPNQKICKIAGIGVLESVKVAVFGMECIDLCNYTIKITRIQFLYNKDKQNEKKYSRKHS